MADEVSLSDAEFDLATGRGEALLHSEPRAVAARYDATSGRVVVDLVNGCTFAFPPRLVQGLQEASDRELAQVEVLGAGFGLSWDGPDVQVTVAGLMAGIFGTQAYMAREMARRAGSTRSAAKALASKVNGAKGGRPRALSAG